MRGTMRSRGVGICVAVAFALTACAGDSGNETAKSQAASATTVTTRAAIVAETTTSSSSTTTTVEPTTTTTAAPEKSASLQSVRALQERLEALGYDVGTPDGKWGARTTYSLMAFQKVEGLSVDGQDGPQTQAAL